MNPKVDFYFNKGKSWQEEIRQLRTIVLDCGLTEELKWGVPCYIFQKRNIVLIHVFKEYCALLFFKGALLNDPNGILVQQTENVQSARQIRFTNSKQIAKMRSILKAYIFEAIEVEKAGLEVKLKPITEYTIPEEFQAKLDGLVNAFLLAFNSEWVRQYPTRIIDATDHIEVWNAGSIKFVKRFAHRAEI